MLNAYASPGRFRRWFPSLPARLTAEMWAVWVSCGVSMRSLLLRAVWSYPSSPVSKDPIVTMSFPVRVCGNEGSEH